MVPERTVDPSLRTTVHYGEAFLVLIVLESNCHSVIGDLLLERSNALVN